MQKQLNKSKLAHFKMEDVVSYLIQWEILFC